MVGATLDNRADIFCQNPEFIYSMIDNLPLGFLYLSYVRDSAGDVVDLKIDATNRVFEKFIDTYEIKGMSANAVLGRETRHLIKVCQEVEQKRGKQVVEDFMFSNSVKMSAVVYMPTAGEFVCFVSLDPSELQQSELEDEKSYIFSEPQNLLRVNADIQHLLRTHLNAIMGFAELVNSETDQNNKDRYMEIIKENVQALMDSSIVKGSDAEPVVETQGVVKQSGKPRILVAEDTESNYMLVSYILKGEYELVWARDGVEAVEAFENERPDLVLMDVRMPRMSGLAATERIREVDKEIPIIALTAFAFESDKAKTMEAGCTDFIAKPINAMALRDIIRRHLR